MVNSNFLLYPDDSCVMNQHKDIVSIKKKFEKTLKISATGLWITN